MSKTLVNEIFSRYGLSDKEIHVYSVYLRVPRASSSEVFLFLKQDKEIEIEEDEIDEITEKLVKKGFLKEIKGIITRYIPLEPYFELFCKESEGFRDKLSEIKEKVSSYQSDRFKDLEKIQNEKTNQIEDIISSQTKSFIKDAETQNKNKEDLIFKTKERVTETEKNFESTIHDVLNVLNKDIDSISQSFQADNETKIEQTKGDLDSLFSKMLDDFSAKLKDLELELKKELDEHVERHKTISRDLSPKMKLILEKYFERMNKIVASLKENISELLLTHVKHLSETTDSLETRLKTTFEENHETIAHEISEFKNIIVQLTNNLLEFSDLYTGISKELGSRFSAFKALLFKKHEEYQDKYDKVKEKILKYSEPLQEDLIEQSDKFIKKNKQTTEKLKSELTEIISSENHSLSSETKDLNQEAKQKIDIQLEHLGADLSEEIDDKFHAGVDDCSNATIRLKDLIEKTIIDYRTQYNQELTNHKEAITYHYSNFDNIIKQRTQSWAKKLDHQFNNTKNTISEKIQNHINDWEEISSNLNTSLVNLLEIHKAKYKENADALRTELSGVTKEQIQAFKTKITEFISELQNAIEKASESAELNEDKLMEVFKASKDIPEISEANTWHTLGTKPLLATIKGAIKRASSSLYIVTPQAIPEILDSVLEKVNKKKKLEVVFISNWDMREFREKMKELKEKNVNFRQLALKGDFYAVSRDKEEIIFAPDSDNEENLISIISTQENYTRLYTDLIFSIFQSKSRPIR
ncbi:MAG: hypothetical protein EU541_06890 [Promethearchaeota archaeon]|nr:MAG: hypothetical protein EU541_06890 [Candidatus Lokiarchaeota archaeon]